MRRPISLARLAFLRGCSSRFFGRDVGYCGRGWRDRPEVVEGWETLTLNLVAQDEAERNGIPFSSI
jgi:hypothetical protein